MGVWKSLIGRLDRIFFVARADLSFHTWRAYDRGMYTVLGIGFIAFGIVLLFTREWSAQFHERWNSKFQWTQWATGPKAMQASRVANVVVGVGLIALGLIFLTGGYIF
jgi:hypothetical protein